MSKLKKLRNGQREDYSALDKKKSAKKKKKHKPIRDVYDFKRNPGKYPIHYYEEE